MTPKFDKFLKALRESASKSEVGLANVDNTSDANKPVSTAQQTALRRKLDVLFENKGDIILTKRYDGVVSGGVTINDIDNSILFDGVAGTKLDLGFPIPLRATPGKDIEIMVRFRSTSASDGFIFAMRRAATNTEKGYSLNLRGNGRLRKFIGDSANHVDNSDLGTVGQFNTGSWHAVFLTINRTENKFDIILSDGTVLHTASIATIGDADTSAIPTAPFTFAAARDGANGTKAIEISTLRVWNRILTATERAEEVASPAQSVVINGLKHAYSGVDFVGTTAVPTKVLDKGYNIIPFPVGTSGQVLTADDTTFEGVRWGAAGYPTVTVAQDGTGDYNGTTLDTIITALEAVKTAGGGEVFVKRGTYTVGSMSGLDSNAALHVVDELQNVTLCGEGFSTIIDASSHRIAAPTGKGILRFTNAKNLVIRDMYFIGDQSDVPEENQSNKTPTFLSIVGSEDVWLENLKYLDGLNAFVVSGASENVSVNDIMVLNCEHAYMIQGDGTNNININNVSHRKFARDSRTGYVQTFAKYNNQIYNINTSNCLAEGHVREVMRINGGNGLNFSNISSLHATDAEETDAVFNILGGVKNVNINNVAVINNKRVVRFLPSGGDNENINISNIVADNVAEVVGFTNVVEGTYYNRNISITNAKGTFQDGDNYGVGMYHPLLQNITFRDCKLFNIAGATGGRAVRINVDTYDVNFYNCQLSGASADFQKEAGAVFGGVIENCRFVNNNIVGETGGFAHTNYQFKSFKGNWHGTDETSPSFYVDYADISIGTIAPATTPTKVGDTFIDTTNGNIYIAKGTTASTDWLQVNN